MKDRTGYFKPKVYQSNRGRGQTRHNYNQRRFQDRFSPNNVYKDDQGMDKTIEVGQDIVLITEVVMGIIQEVIKGMGNQTINNNRRGNIWNQNYNRNRSRSYERQNRDRRDGRSISNSRSRSHSRATTNIDRVRCFKCREYNHFVRDCPTRQTHREVEQIQQIFNMDEDQTILQSPLLDTDQDEQTIIPVETRDNLNV